LVEAAGTSGERAAVWLRVGIEMPFSIVRESINNIGENGMSKLTTISNKHLLIGGIAIVLIAAVLSASGLDPTMVIGGRVRMLGTNAKMGQGEILVAEADESDGSFLLLSPTIAVVTNIDREHMDCYRNMRDVKKTFLEFMDRVPFYGMVVVCNDDPLLRRLLPSIRRRTITYGTRRGSDFLIKPGNSAIPQGNERPTNDFRVTYRGKDLGEFRLHVPGMHNILNATAAIAVGIGLDVSVEQIRIALDTFRGVDRRFQLRGKAGGVSVIDDYGHHPTEIRATLAAAKQCGFRRVHVIFQPHRYTRTRDLMDEFTTAFKDADSLMVLDIYAASEQPIEGITGEVLAGDISKKGGRTARYASSFADAVEKISDEAHDGDMVLTLGAGSVSQLGPMILEKLQARETVPQPI